MSERSNLRRAWRVLREGGPIGMLRFRAEMLLENEILNKVQLTDEQRETLDQIVIAAETWDEDELRKYLGAFPRF